MDNILRNFYNNESQREMVKLYMVEVLKEMAVEKAFDGESVVGIKEAKDLIDKTFDKLEEKYGIIPAPIISNSK